MSNTTSTTLGYLNTATTLSALTGTQSPISISGLGSGINTQAIINALMQQNAAPQAALQTMLTTTNTKLATYQALSADATTLQSYADGLATPSAWQQWTASSSSSDVTATVGSGAVGGSLTFTVDQLASAASVVSSASVSSTAAQVATPGTSFLLASGGAAVGLTGFAGQLASGSHTITVTQASAAASDTGTALPAATTITAGDALAVNVNGQTYNLSLAGGANLTPAQVAAQVAAAAKSAGAPINASVNSQGQLVVASSSEGSTQSLQVTGGSALGELGLSAMASAATGQDGIVSVDGTTTTLSTVTAGQAVTLNGPSGASVTATFSGGLRAGTVSAAQITTGDGTLGGLVSAINSAGLGMTAAAIQTGTSAYRLQIGSSTTGAGSSIDLPPGAFSGLGSLNTLTAGSDAQLTVGSGAGAFTVTSASNNVSNLMPGVTLNLLSANPSGAVTVSLAPDGAGMATKVGNLVSAANAMIKDLNLSMATPSTTTTTSGSSTSAPAGVMLGDPTAESVLNGVLSAISGTAGVNSTGSAGIVGISINQDGTLAFDQTAFLSAYTANPTKVANTFTQGGTATNSAVSVYEASDYTQKGTYAVNITAAATQATATGSALGATGTISGPETITLGSAGATATYSATAGQTLSQIAAGISAAASAKNLGLTASVQNGALTIQSLAYGSGSSFTVASTASGAGSTGLVSSPNSPQTFSGTDVAGTINGVAAAGTGQLLIGALNTPQQGLLLRISTTPSELTANGGNLGTVTYQPGIAQSLATAASNAADPAVGLFTQAIAGVNQEVTSLTSQIQAWNPILAEQQSALAQEYTAMETALATLKSTQQAVFPSSTSSSSGG